jgi:hypothetical protein
MNAAETAIVALVNVPFLVDAIERWWWWVVGFSAVVFLLSPIAVIGLIAGLPKDFLSANESKSTIRWRHPVIRWVLRILKNGMGLLLLVAGIVMLIAPGQGLLTIAAGLILMEFPGKRRFERWLCTQPPIWRSINWLRRKLGREPLEKPPGYHVS